MRVSRVDKFTPPHRALEKLFFRRLFTAEKIGGNIKAENLQKSSTKNQISIKKGNGKPVSLTADGFSYFLTV